MKAEQRSSSSWSSDLKRSAPGLRTSRCARVVSPVEMNWREKPVAVAALGGRAVSDET